MNFIDLHIKFTWTTWRFYEG